MEASKEIWRPIEGYEDYYEVSNQGRIRSLDREISGPFGSTRRRKGVVRRPYCCKGNLTLRLSLDGVGYRVEVARVVWQAFKGSVPKYITHLDGDPLNNQPSNLVGHTRIPRSISYK